jgi:DNA-binding SARP family transcriptional activator
MAPEVEFCLLGPIVVRQHAVAVTVPRGKQRVILAMLLLNAGRVVGVDELGDTLWVSRPPSWQVAVQNYVMRLRNSLGDIGRARIITQPPGYLIHVEADELDLSRFVALLDAARAAAENGSWDQAAAHARQALRLWRDEPLTGISCEALAAREAPRLGELRLQALETRIDADLHLGRHAQVITDLWQLVSAHPLRERFHHQLMLALYRDGRQAEALDAYQHARHMLIGELGIEPGQDLRDLHQRILSADQALAATEASRSVDTGPMPDAADGAAAVIPRQLPGAAAHFTGRTAELTALDTMLEEADGQRPGTVVISAIGGMAGVGKTALAVYWAHQAAGRFPGGQLYVNLRGFAPAASPAGHAEVIRGFLHALGVPAERIPPDLAAQTGLYRSLLADRKILIVLDNARDEEQVRPLLPPGPGCLTVVTSRNQLIGLAAAEGARLLTLDVLTPAEARQTLTARLGQQRARADPEAVAEIARLCAYLPLALAIVAARATASPALPLPALAAELRAGRGRLDALETGDSAVSVRSVFSWSCRHLSEPAQRMFRLLGLHPGPDISAAAAASLAGTSMVGTRRDLAELTRAHLLTEHAPGRYDCHDLLRAYAAEQAAALDEQEREAALGRVLDHYLHTSYQANRLLDSTRDVTVSLAPPRPGVTPEHLTEAGQALDWFATEYRVLLSAVILAADNGFDVCAWQLPWTMTSVFRRMGHWHEQAATQRAAAAAAARLGDRSAQALSCRLLGLATVRSGDYDQARAYFSDALGLYRRLGDRIGQARAQLNFGWLDERQERYAAALSHGSEALSLFQEAGHKVGQAEALNSVGWCQAMLGDYRQARTSCQQALTLQQELGDRHAQFATWDSLGYAEHQLGNLTEAITCYRKALSLLREDRDRIGEAETLAHLGDALHAAGSLEQARDAWQQALDILHDLGHPEADTIQQKLRSLPDVAAGPSPQATGNRSN